ncbi:hypothetical protein [Streptomyces sp. NPDC003710]
MSDPLGFTREDFEALYRRLHAAAGADPTPRGALDRITPDLIRQAAGEVRTGRTVSMAAPVETRQEPDCPDPARHWLTTSVPPRSPAEGLHFAMDRLAMSSTATPTVTSTRCVTSSGRVVQRPGG